MARKREPVTALLSRVRKARFLQAFRRYGLVSIAARRSGVARQTVSRDWMKNEKFRSEFEAIQEEWVERLEGEVVKLATGQYKRQLVSGGAVVGEEPIRDLKALEMLLKAYKPRLYREQLGVQVTGGTTHEVKVKKEITAVLIADAARILAEAGVTVGAAVVPENAEGQGIQSILDDMKFRHKTLPAFTQPAVDAEDSE